MDYTITLTTTEQKSLEYITPDVDDYITNFSTERARIAKLEIISLLVAHCNANSIAIATGEDAQVTQAYDLKVVMTAAEKQAELDKNIHKE